MEFEQVGAMATELARVSIDCPHVHRHCVLLFCGPDLWTCAQQVHRNLQHSAMARGRLGRHRCGVDRRSAGSLSDWAHDSTSSESPRSGRRSRRFSPLTERERGAELELPLIAGSAMRCGFPQNRGILGRSSNVMSLISSMERPDRWRRPPRHLDPSSLDCVHGS